MATTEQIQTIFFDAFGRREAKRLLALHEEKRKRDPFSLDSLEAKNAKEWLSACEKAYSHLYDESQLSQINVSVEPDTMEDSVLREAERIMIELMHCPPHFNKVFDCPTCGFIPSVDGISCRWCFCGYDSAIICIKEY